MPSVAGRGVVVDGYDGGAVEVGSDVDKVDFEDRLKDYEGAVWC